MKKIAKIAIKKNEYQIDLNAFYDLSIPIDMNKKSPSFYDNQPLAINYYKDQYNKIWKTEYGAACNIPIIDLNIHCGSTHTECRSHITKEDLHISKIIKDSFIPSSLISIKPDNSVGVDSYHHDIDDKDLIITKKSLENKLQLSKKNKIEAIIIRTLPNIENEIISKNYNKDSNPYFSNEAISYIKSLGIKHLVVDLPSIDKLNDGGHLGNHQIFWNLKDTPNNNTITELAFIKNEIKDANYLLSLNILNMNLDASPCRPLIYPLL